jgi:hypothetical protein
VTTNKVTAHVVLDCRYSGGALTELREHFPDWDRLSSEKNPNMHTLVFVIDESQCSAFHNRYKGLGRHRGELTFLRALRTTFETPIAA